MAQTTVVTTQPVANAAPVAVVNIKYPRGLPREWTTKLCQCGDDIGGCFAAHLCFPCFQCHVAGQMGEHCCLGCCIANASMVMRSTVRARYNLEGSLCTDCCLSCFCPPCSMAQVSREMDLITKGVADM